MTNATNETKDAVGAFYDAIHDRDVALLLASLDDEFVGQVSEGLPGGCGGLHTGTEAMMRDCWVPIATMFNAVPLPSDRMETVDGRTVVTGNYHGTSPRSGDEFTAAFVHIFTLRSGRIANLLQVTDTRKWPSPTVGGAPAADAKQSQEPAR